MQPVWFTLECSDVLEVPKNSGFFKGDASNPYQPCGPKTSLRCWSGKVRGEWRSNFRAILSLPYVKLWFCSLSTFGICIVWNTHLLNLNIYRELMILFAINCIPPSLRIQNASWSKVQQFMFEQIKNTIGFTDSLDAAQVNLGGLEVDWGLSKIIWNMQEKQLTVRKALLPCLAFGKGNWSHDGLKDTKIILLSKNPFKTHPNSHSIDKAWLTLPTFGQREFLSLTFTLSAFNNITMCIEIINLLLKNALSF